MKKLFLAFLAFFLALAVIGGIFAYIQYQKLDTQFGISEAPLIPHSQFIQPQTRTQVVINPSHFKGFIQRHLPPTVPIPPWLESFYSLDDLLNKALPHRVAIFTNADYIRGNINFLAYTNERVGGPAIADFVKKEGALEKIPMIVWTEGGVQLQERGVLSVGGSFPMPEGLDVFVLDKGSLGGPQVVPEISGEHFIELAIDNGNGELLTMAGLAMDALGVDWNNIFNTKEFGMALPLFNKVSTVRMYVNMVTDDEMSIHMRVDALAETEFIFNMIKSMGMPEIKRYLLDLYQLELIGDPAWSKEESAFIGDFTLKGMEKYLALPFQNIKM